MQASRSLLPTTKTDPSLGVRSCRGMKSAPVRHCLRCQPPCQPCHTHLLHRCLQRGNQQRLCPRPQPSASPCQPHRLKHKHRHKHRHKHHHKHRSQLGQPRSWLRTTLPCMGARKLTATPLIWILFMQPWTAPQRPKSVRRILTWTCKMPTSLPQHCVNRLLDLGPLHPCPPPPQPQQTGLPPERLASLLYLSQVVGLVASLSPAFFFSNWVEYARRGVLCVCVCECECVCV